MYTLANTTIPEYSGPYKTQDNGHKVKYKRIILSIFFLLIFQTTGSLLFALSNPVPELNCTSAVLLDSETGTVLFSKNSDRLIPPASMTKLVTLHVVYEAIAAGILSKDEIITIGEDADFRSLPPHSSLMFLEKGQRVSVIDLMKGLAVPSGNDAAIALAERVAGSVPAFVEMMNSEVKKAGFKHMHFEDASGLSEKNKVTAADFAAFCVYYINRHPKALSELHSLLKFTYPKKKNIPEGKKSVYGPITQYNRNNLLGRYPWSDGLKTGYIDESGYNIAVTAKMNDRRLIAVLMGGPGKNAGEGALIRAIDVVNLLSYGFYRFTNYKTVPGIIDSVPVFSGEKNNLKVSYSTAGKLTIPRELIYETELLFETDHPVIAPVKRGEKIGRLFILLKGEKVASFPVIAEENIRRGSLIKRIIDRIRLWFRRSGVSRKVGP